MCDLVYQTYVAVAASAVRDETALPRPGTDSPSMPPSYTRPYRAGTGPETFRFRSASPRAANPVVPSIQLQTSLHNAGFVRPRKLHANRLFVRLSVRLRKMPVKKLTYFTAVRLRLLDTVGATYQAQHLGEYLPDNMYIVIYKE